MKTKLTKKEREILTYLCHGAHKTKIIEELNNFFGYSKTKLKQILDSLKKKKMIRFETLIIPINFSREMLVDEVSYIFGYYSKYRTLKEFRNSKKIRK